MSLQEQFQWFCETWIREKQKAKETGDASMYMFFLKEAKKQFGRLYGQMTNETWLEFMDNLLKTISCEIKENSINYKNIRLP